jgi:hypothetical protein
MYCVTCLREKTAKKQSKKRDWFLLTSSLQLLLGLLLLWIAAYYMGRLLLSVPTEFHEGSVWKKVTDF